MPARHKPAALAPAFARGALFATASAATSALARVPQPPVQPVPCGRSFRFLAYLAPAPRACVALMIAAGIGAAGIGVKAERRSLEAAVGRRSRAWPGGRTGARCGHSVASR